MATLALLTDIAPRLINIYGQHDSQTLLKPENHLRLLDAYAGLSVQREDFTRIVQPPVRSARADSRTGSAPSGRRNADWICSPTSRRRLHRRD